ncbi:MAG: hypothetical protein AB7E36_16010, partial [Salinivirgaceae bacterium]
MESKSQMVSHYAVKVIQIESQGAVFYFAILHDKLKIFSTKKSPGMPSRKIEEMSLTDEILEIIFNHKEKEAIFELLNCLWVLNEFLFPEHILTPNILELVLNKEINDSHGLVDYLLKDLKLHNKISPTDYLDKVLNNIHINTKQRKHAADILIANSINLKGVMAHLELEIMRFIADGKKEKLLKLFKAAKLPIDISQSVDVLKIQWMNSTMEYVGKLKIPTNYVLVTNFNQLSSFSSKWITYQWDNVMIRHAFILLNTYEGILCFIQYANSYFYPSRFLEMGNS